ncbi:11-cis retinol dehydrogenase-like isoform X2 [Gouania willdenowi]|nr:dehydrogenase/reductase SDR family member 9 isoform X2 [Gouania willdenowi]
MFLHLLWSIPLWFLYRWVKETRRVSNKEHRYVFITGCDSGFGHLLAKHLDQRGFHVIAGCYTENGEVELKKISSERLSTVHVDVSDSQSVSKAAATINTLVGQKGLWGLVNNAGISVPTAPCDWLTVDDYKQMLSINLFGVIDVTLSLLPLIKKAKGRVVNVSSVFGRISAFGGPYCVSKFGVEAFTDSLRLDMVPFGVKVLCIEPGFFKTNVSNQTIVGNCLKKQYDKLPQDVKDDYGSIFLETMVEEMNFRFKLLTDPDLMKVVGCMEHAIAAVHPRTRYSPGWDAKLFWLPLSYMPSCIVDYLLLINYPKLKISEK